MTPKRRRRRLGQPINAAGSLALVLVLTALGALAGCAPARPSSGAAPTPSADVTNSAGAAVLLVEMGDHWFIPARLSVPVGSTVEWRMAGTQEHDVWAFDGSFHSPTMGPGMRYAHTFTKVGTYKYLCIPHHGDGMYGEVVVVPCA